MKFYTFILLSLCWIKLSGQDIHNNSDSLRASYQNAFKELKGMLEGKIKPSFKRAVFITENAYLNNKIEYKAFEGYINYLAGRGKIIAKQSDFSLYNERDVEQVKRNYAVFKLMTDTNRYYIDSLDHLITKPFTYDFDDFWGEGDWTKMFVLKLLETNTGNCHSLPFLYKILSEEIGAKAHLAIAPNHIYIKQYAKLGGWYNTELTSGQFPIDAWIMASGYIHLSAIQNGVYMDTLSLKQSIALCMTDLAKGYEKKFSNDFEFIFKCVDETLKYYPIYTNALLLKVETKKRLFEKMMKDSNTQYPAQMLKDTDAKTIFNEMEKLYFHIYQLGYRTMPKEMYISWLVDLKNHKAKYQNKEITGKFNSATNKK